MKRTPTAVGSILVLALWGAALWYLDLTDRWALLLSTRTRWVLPVGAAILTAGAIGRVVSLRGDRVGSQPHRRAGLGLALVAVPAVVVLALPPTTLTASAASTRAGFGGGSVVSAPPSDGGQPTLVQVAAAHYSADVLHELAPSAGRNVSYVGFVNRDQNAPADQFLLTRFVVTCCVTDALVAEIRVVGADTTKLKVNDWVRVSGRLYPTPHDILLLADTVRNVPRPAHPYITP